jgi:hypothetical protein
MQTMANLPTFNLEVSEQKEIQQTAGAIMEFRHFAEKADWNQLLWKIEKWTNRVCIILVAVSALYFTPIVISILTR